MDLWLMEDFGFPGPLLSASQMVGSVSAEGSRGCFGKVKARI